METRPGVYGVAANPRAIYRISVFETQYPTPIKKIAFCKNSEFIQTHLPLRDKSETDSFTKSSMAPIGTNSDIERTEGCLSSWNVVKLFVIKCVIRMDRSE